ncbi:polysaccharide pyruvyl transferase family protein [Flexivirga sp. ID2601S]|uniref:Polysaccharide pyruvyl transferase family protein n=1 Tax=Flexivirga aerilata TaxID=1656889 RepID=A0A849AFS4_9MICO|nr:polysaccharide pyruvyl transferase family protein [Flexivirga aerilata]NNG39269.1 polysaccharide pyruvyl transferase family protein [Flexivirga aerilata]
MRVVLLHAYSATNAGDGLLVEEALDLIDEALPGSSVTVAAQHPETFPARPGVEIIDAGFSKRGPGRDLARLLCTLGDYDLIVGVGGGYLRSRDCLEGLKTVFAHGPQLIAASRSKRPTFYLPQSVGPLNGGSRALFIPPMRRLRSVFLRDDRSVTESGLDNAVRFPDMALLTRSYAPRDGRIVDPRPVLSVRKVHGKSVAALRTLATRFNSFDGYVQSTGAGNDDSAAVAELGPEQIIPRDLIMARSGPRRVVVAVRLHAALMAINAGHYVVHLAYERKGFGAFEDLGLPEYVHNVSSFDVQAVKDQVVALLSDAPVRADYDAKITASRTALAKRRDSLVKLLRESVDR